MNFYKIDENAATGATGAGSIATSPSRFNGDKERKDLRAGVADWKQNLPQEKKEREQLAITKAQLEKAKKLKQEKRSKFRNFASKLFSRKIDEALDVAGITSQLKGLENKNNFDNTNSVTYGVEDDDGNLMKITVRAEDGKSFENRLALELGEIQNDKIYGYQNTGVSLAEILFNLKDEFNIIDVEFPEIPSDIVYNSDKASLASEQMDTDMPQEESTDMEMPMGDENLDQNGFEDMENPDMENPDMENPDEMDQAEEFTEPVEENDFKSLFKELVQLMTAQAEKEKAVADAEAEKARALQAEYTAKAANHEVSRQEELIRMQSEVEQQKKREKEAKQYADLAKYRVNKDKGSTSMNFEGYDSFLQAVINEDMGLDSDLDSESTIRKELQAARLKYQIQPDDDDATRTYKQKAWQSVNMQLQSKLRQIRDKTVFDQKRKIDMLNKAKLQTQAPPALQTNRIGENLISEGLKMLKHRHEEYRGSPAVGRCNCGAMVELDDPMDNICENCERCYNSSGQEVTPTWECDEEGNPYSDFDNGSE